MTWLFLRFYAAVLVVLFLAWWIHGWVLKQRAEADLQRVIVAAHTGGARLVARELDRSPAGGRAAVLDCLRTRFTPA